MIILFRMHGGMHLSLVESYMFHDIYLSIIGPLQWRRRTKHPDCWPGANTLWQACFDLEPAVRPVAFALAYQSRRRVFLAFHIFFAGFNDQHAILDPGIFLAFAGIIFKFVIAPAIAADIIIPLGTIRKS